VPLDPAVRRSGDAGTPIVKSEPDSPAAKALLQIAGQALRAVRVSVGVE
jgi:ATP-binding protein involved in chromosome partitioning